MVLLHQVYCETDHSAQDLVDLLKAGSLYPPIDVAVHARAVYDALTAAELCEPAESSLKVHRISVSDRLAQGILRVLDWVDTRDQLAGGFAKRH